jgi:DNA-directed RNA polymerase specialized sigma24 family protein
MADQRGGELQQRVEIEDHLAFTEQQSDEVLSLHEGLERLKSLDPRHAEIMEMHYFAGESIEDIAAALRLSERTLKRELQTGRLFLKDQLTSRKVEPA